MLTLPSDRELVALVSLATEAYEDSSKLILCITDTRQHVNYLIQKLQHATEWDTPTKLFRDGIEVKGGGRVVVRSAADPGSLMGLSPTKIVLFGNIGELYYHLKSMLCPIEAVA